MGFKPSCSRIELYSHNAFSYAVSTVEDVPINSQADICIVVGTVNLRFILILSFLIVYIMQAGSVFKLVWSLILSFPLLS